MTRDDATKEAMARIRMNVDMYDAEWKQAEDMIMSQEINSPDALELEAPDTGSTEKHWRYGAPEKLTNSLLAMRDCQWIDHPMRQGFDINLRRFLHKHYPEEPLEDDYRLQVSKIQML